MKRQWIALVLAVVMLCAVSPWAGAEEMSFLEIMRQANQLDVFLSDGGRVAVKTDTYDAYGNISSWFRYADDSLWVHEDDMGITIVRDDQSFGFDNVEKKPFYILFLDNTRENMAMNGADYSPLPGEQFLNCIESEGELAVSTVIQDSRMITAYQQELLNLGYQDAVLANIFCQYILDADTYRIKSMAMFLELEDDSLLLLSEKFWAEDPHPYEIDGQLLNMIFSQDHRTVTVIADPGTDEETIYSAQVGKGCMVQIFCSAEHPNLYLDRECTQPVEFIDDYDNDLLLYTICAERDILYSQTEGIQPYPEEEQCQACGAWYELGTTHVCKS